LTCIKVDDRCPGIMPGTRRAAGRDTFPGRDGTVRISVGSRSNVQAGRAAAIGRAALLLAAMLVGAMAPAVRAQVFLGAHAELDCGQCHVTDALGAPVALLEEQEVICNACHEDILGTDHATAHPSRFVPSRPLPPSYPLDAGGRFTCSSCHGLHDDTPLLLRSGGPWACRDCH